MKEKIIELVERYDTIIIHRHVRPDPDALGSQGGLMELLKNHYKQKNIYVVGDVDPELTFILEMDEISDDHFIGALSIICDTANTERISDERYTLADKVIKIDHHPNDEPYGDYMWIDEKASSVSEMIFDLYETWAKQTSMEMTETAARRLYAGIIGDTGRFRYPNTTSKTFYSAGELIKQPFSMTEIYGQLEKKSLNDARLEGYVLSNFELLPSGAGTISLTKELLQQYGVTTSETAKLVNSFSNVEGIKAWVFFVEEPDGLIRIRLRSKGPIINTLAQRFNGGGHPLAAGASVKKWEDTKKIITELDQLCLQS